MSSNDCTLVKIEKNDKLGRYLTAAQDIEEGEKILQVSPLLIAPKAVSYPLCLGCHKKLITTANFYKCSKCEWPLCGKECENSKQHIGECKIFAESSFKPNVSSESTKQSCYSIIGPLRALLLKGNDPDKFALIMDMQSHVGSATNASSYGVLKRSLVPLFIQTLKIDTTEDEILTILSIFDVNSFDVRNYRQSIEARGLYPLVSLMAHDCVRNTNHFFQGENFDIIVSATVPIATGEMITTSYTQVLWGTLARLSHLKQTKNFDCTCKRCEDATELDIYAGSVLCPECRKEYIDRDTSPKLISTNPLDTNAKWACDKCEYVIDADEMKLINEGIQFEVKQLNTKDPAQFENFLKKYEESVHSTNSFVLEVTYVLIQIYGNVEGFLLQELSDELLARKIDLCREMLPVADVLEPGSSIFRGYLLYDLQAAITAQVERDIQSQSISKEASNAILTNASTLLQEAANILKLDANMSEEIQSSTKKLSKLMAVEE